MTSLRTTFGKAASGDSRFSAFWLLVWALFILDAAQRREEEQRKKRGRADAPPPKPKPPACRR